MRTIQEIFKFCAWMFLNDDGLGKNIRKAIISIINCRTVKMGRRLSRCEDCGYEEYSYCSCRNRNCPLCQTFAKEKWVLSRSNELLNTKYFHIVFTLPHKLNEIVKFNQSVMYNALFQAVSETLIQLGYQKKHVGGQIGAILVLHTWCQKLLLHPHLHCIVPGGGLINGKWIECKKDIFIHVNILSKVFRGKYLEKLEALYKSGKLDFPSNIEGLYTPERFEYLINRLRTESWYVYNKKVFSNPIAVIEYLGRYTHKVAITNCRIVKFENGNVTFKYRDNKDNGKEKELTITAQKFVSRFLQHVLPTGFQKIRYIGIHSNRNKNTKLKLCQMLTQAIQNAENFVKITTEMVLKRMTNGRYNICPACNGHNFGLVGILRPQEVINST
jgi:hypothetical protein